jgi:predicted amidophosphoribosyltransferase
MYRSWRRVRAAVLDALAPARCAACGESGDVLCEACAEAVEASPPPLLAGVRAAFVYDGEVRQILHHGKFRDCRSALRALTWMAAPRLRPPAGAATVVPVALARRRLAERGYNQAAIVAAALAEFHRLPVAHLLTRTRDTPPQSTLDRAARQASVLGAFRAGTDARAASVWLIDDVLTTGATTQAARRALLDAGAADVEIAVLAAVV